MNDNDLRGTSYLAGFFMLLAFTLAGIILVTVITPGIVQSMTGLAMKDFKPGEHKTTTYLIHVTTFLIGFLLPTLLTVAVMHRRPAKFFGLSLRNITPAQIGLTIVITFAAMVVASSLAEISRSIPLPTSWKLDFEATEKAYADSAVSIINFKSPIDYIVTLALMALLPAICEELLFRGGLQNFLIRGTGKPWLALIVVSIIFSLAHGAIYSFLTRMFLGLILGLIYYYSGRLWLSILAHFLNNAVTITILYVAQLSGKNINDTMNDQHGSVWTILGMPVVILLIVAFKKQSQRAKSNLYSS